MALCQTTISKRIKKVKTNQESQEPCSSVVLPALFNKENQHSNARRTTCPRITFFQNALAKRSKMNSTPSMKNTKFNNKSNRQ